jgi:glucan phosphoethanolaminetransferase (alkaline phosphatase superfamily)
MRIKHLIIFNLVFSTFIILFFYHQFDLLTGKSIPIHIALVGYGLLLIYLTGLLFARFFPKVIAGPLIITLIIAGQLFLFLTYAGYHLGIQIWGYPLTFDIARIYIFELKNLSGKLPLPDSVVLSIVISVVLITIIPVIASSGKILSDLQQKSSVFFTKKKLLPISLLYLLFPLLFFGWGWIKDTLNYNDPVLSFIQYDLAQGHTITYAGFDGAGALKEYPKNQDFDKKNVILIICDALRSDHTSAYGYYRNTTPFLDSIIKSDHAVRVDHFFSTSSRSVNGVLNILASDYNILNAKFFLHDLLWSQGYKINFIVSGDHTNFYNLRKHYGNNIEYFHDGVSALTTNPEASINNDKAVVLDNLAGIPSSDGKPAFFYIHFMSTHHAGIADTAYFIFKPNRTTAFNTMISAEILNNDYDNRVSQVDAYLKQTMKILKQKGFLDNAIVVITADHGQGLTEFGFVGHAQSVFPSEIRIPLILFETGNKTNIQKVNLPFANQLDIAPSIVDLLGIPIPKTWGGFSVFKNERRDFIFQQEKSFYSCIWHDKQNIYQFIYNSNDKHTQVFDVGVTNIPTDNIQSQINEKRLRLVKVRLEEFFDIEIQQE